MCLNRLMFMVVGKYTVNIWILWDVEKKLMFSTVCIVSPQQNATHVFVELFCPSFFHLVCARETCFPMLQCTCVKKKTFQRQVFREKSAKHID